VAVSPLRYLSDDEDGERKQACLRLHAALNALAEAGIPARGEVGPDDPLQAAGDVLTTWPADEIIYIGPMQSHRTWLESDFEICARDLFGVPVSTVFGQPTVRAAAPAVT
jgi:hypothetical protein